MKRTAAHNSLVPDFVTSVTVRTLNAVHEYLLAEADLYDLNAQEGSDGGLLPSTSSIGTSQWKTALEDLADAHGLPELHVTELLSSDDCQDPTFLVPDLFLLAACAPFSLANLA